MRHIKIIMTCILTVMILALSSAAARVYAYPGTDSGPYVEALNGNSMFDGNKMYPDNSDGGISTAVSMGADSVSVDIRSIKSTEQNRYTAVLFEDGYIDSNADGINEILYTDEETAERAAAEGTAVISFEDLRTYCSDNGFMLLTALSFMDTMSSCYGKYVNFIMHDMNEDVLESCISAVMEYGYAEKTVFTITDYSGIAELLSMAGLLSDAGRIYGTALQICLDMEPLILEATGKTVIQEDNAEMVVDELSTSGILEYVECVSMDAGNLKALCEYDPDFIDTMHSLGVSVRAVGSPEDAAELTGMGADIIAASDIAGTAAASEEACEGKNEDGTEDSAEGQNAPETYTETEAETDVKQYAVYFITSGHGIPSDPLMIDEGDTVPVPDVLADEGFSFTGWFCDSTLTEIYDFSRPVTSETYIYAGWIPDETEDLLEPEDRNYAVSFDGNGKEISAETQNVSENETAEEPSGMEYEGFTFTGWYLDAECSIPYDFSNPVSSDIILYAGWEENKDYGETLPVDGIPEEPVTETEKEISAEAEPIEETSEEEQVQNGAAEEIVMEDTARVTITFDGNGADYNTFGTQTFTAGEEQYFAGEISKNGYDVSGWSEDPESAEAVYSINSYVSDEWIKDNQGDITLYAVWEKKTSESECITVHFDGNGADFSSFEDQTFYAGLPEQYFTGDINRKGYKFSHWTFPEDTSYSYSLHSSVTDSWIRDLKDITGGYVTLAAVWEECSEITVRFNANGADKCTFIDQTYVSGSAGQRFEGEISREGYTFLGWSPDPDSMEGIYTANCDVDDELITGLLSEYPGVMDLYAVWQKDSVSLTVAFDGNGADSNTFSTQTFVTGGTDQCFTGEIKRNGYTAAGWSVSPDSFSPEYDLNMQLDDELIRKIEKNAGNPVIFYAVWQMNETVYVSFDTCGIGEAPGTVELGNGGFLTLPENPDGGESYEFYGWYTDPGYTEAFDPQTPVTGDMTLYALWNERIPDIYDVVFDTRGFAPAPDKQQIKEGGSITMPQDPEAPGYMFTGWYEDPSCTRLYDLSNKVYGSITLYAGWKTAGTENMISYDYYGNNSSLSPVSSGSCQLVYADENEDNNAGTEDTYRTWTVEFVTGMEGMYMEPITVLDGQAAEIPVPEEPDGYVFGGWFLDDGYVNVYDMNSLVTSDLTLYAKWMDGESAENGSGYETEDLDSDSPEKEEETEASCTVIFRENGHGLSVPSQTVSKGDLLEIPVDPEAENYTFAGWYRDKNCTVLYDFDEPVTGSMNLYAGWKLEGYSDSVYKVSFVTDGIVTSTQILNAGDRVIKPADPSKQGFIFTGWSREDSGEMYNFSDPVISDIELHAEWVITRAVQPPETKNETLGSDSGINMNGNNTGTPQTGDTNGTIIYMIVGMNALILMSVGLLLLKKKKSKT